MDWYGTIYRYEETRKLRVIPIGIGTNGTVTRDIARGSVLTEESFSPDATTFIYALRKEQEEALAAGE